MMQESVRCYSPAVLQSYSSDLAPSNFHSFGSLKHHFGGRRFHSNEEVEMVVRELLRMQQPDFYREGIFKLVPEWDKCINILGIM
jgi:hypothetical protein